MVQRRLLISYAEDIPARRGRPETFSYIPLGGRLPDSEVGSWEHAVSVLDACTEHGVTVRARYDYMVSDLMLGP